MMEATRKWVFMYDQLVHLVEKADIAHPNEWVAISSAAVKTDRTVAKVWANLARSDYLPIAYAAPKEIGVFCVMVRHRNQPVWLCSQTKNRIHVTLAGNNLVSLVNDLFGIKQRQYLAEVFEVELCTMAR
jgi:hypothetical protein